MKKKPMTSWKQIIKRKSIAVGLGKERKEGRSQFQIGEDKETTRRWEREKSDTGKRYT